MVGKPAELLELVPGQLIEWLRAYFSFKALPEDPFAFTETVASSNPQ